MGMGLALDTYTRRVESCALHREPRSRTTRAGTGGSKGCRVGAAQRVWAIGLTEAETLEVEHMIDFVTRAVVDGHISQHFGDWIVERLAEDCAEAFIARRRR